MAGLDLIGQLSLTTAVVVTIAAFGAMVPQLAHGRLGPAEAVRFMLLAIVPMMQYALPFAGGFASTLVFHRMAQDNEVLAAHASGLSHRAVLAPALGIALGLAAIMSALSEGAIPSFLRSMERLIAADAAKILVSRIEGGEAVRFEGWIIHADSVKRVRPDPRSGAFDSMLLRRVVALRLDDQDRIEREVTADRAQVWFFNDWPGQNESRGDSVVLWMELGTVLAVEQGKASGTSSEVPLSFEIPGMFSDDPKFFTMRELARLRERPEEINYIDRLRRILAFHMGERLWTTHVRDALRSGGEARLVDELGRPAILRGRDIAWNHEEQAWIITPSADGSVELEIVQDERRTRLAGETGRLTTRMGFDPLSSPLTINITLDDVRILDGSGAPAGAPRKRIDRGALVLEQDPVPALLQVPALELLERARPIASGPARDPFIAGPTRDLDREIRRLNHEITSKQHERIAASIACFLMVIGGAVIALRLTAALALTVYLWCFLPAVATVMATEAGQELTASIGPVGLLLLYSGVAAFAAYTVAAYLLVRRR